MSNPEREELEESIKRHLNYLDRKIAKAVKEKRPDREMGLRDARANFYDWFGDWEAVEE